MKLLTYISLLLLPLLGSPVLGQEQVREETRMTLMLGMDTGKREFEKL